MGIKVAIVGAGSKSFGFSTARDLIVSTPICDGGLDIALMDINADHLPEVTSKAQVVADTLNRNVSITPTTDLDEALKDRDFVVSAIEIERHLYWAMDFHVPRKYRFRQVYGENGGPGGIFHALRNMGPTVRIAKTMEKLCPDALLLNFTNPEQKLCEAISRLTSIHAYGLCHGVAGGRAQLAHMLDMPVENIVSEACGMNHFTWFQKIRDKKTGEDLYPRLRELETEGDWLSDWHEVALGRVLFRRFGLWPSPGTNHSGEYIRWAEEFMASEMEYFYDPAEGHPWETGEIPEFVYTVDKVDTKRPWIPPTDDETAPGEETVDMSPSGEQAIPIIEGVACGLSREIDAVNVPNRGWIPNLPDNMVVELPADADGDGVHPRQMAPLPEAIAALLRTQGSIQQLIVEAYAEGSKDKLLQAILLDPVVDSYRGAVQMMEEMLELQKDLLPALT